MEDDKEPLTEVWLRMMGFESCPSSIGPEYGEELRKERLQIWEFNGTGKWLFAEADWIELETRGDLRAMCRVCRIDLPEQTVKDLIQSGI